MTASKPSDPRITVTSSEAAGRKHLVQPYDDHPVVNRATGRAVCGMCGNPGFRRSRLRFTDLSRLLLFRYPVRCTRCGQRQSMGLGVATGATSTRPQSAAALRASAEREDSWKTWTQTGPQDGAADVQEAPGDPTGSMRPSDRSDSR